MKKIGPILDDFKLWQRMTPQGMKLCQIGQVLDLLQFFRRLANKVW